MCRTRELEDDYVEANRLINQVDSAIWQGTHFKTMAERVKMSLQTALDSVSSLSMKTSKRMTALTNARHDLRMWKEAKVHESKEQLEELLGDVAKGWGMFRSKVVDTFVSKANMSNASGSTATQKTNALAVKDVEEAIGDLPETHFARRTFK